MSGKPRGQPKAAGARATKRVIGAGGRAASRDGARPPLWRRICVGTLAMAVLPLVLLIGLAAGIGYFRLQQGPVSVNFLVDPVKAGINQGLPGFSADFDDVIVTLADDGGLELRLRNLELSEPGGATVVSAPQAAIGLSHSALWSLQASPERVELIEPRIGLVYSRNSGVSLTFAGADGGGDRQGPKAGGQSAVESGLRSSAETFDVADLIKSSSQFIRNEGVTASTLREVGLRDATLVLDSEGTRSTWQVPRLLFDVEHKGGASIVSGSARVSSSGRIWSASFRAEDRPNSETLSVATSVRDLVPKELADAIPGIGGLELLDAPTSADIRAQVTRSGEILATEVALEVAGSRLKLPEMDGPLLVLDEGVLNFVYSPPARKLTLKSSLVRSGDTALFVSGSAAQTITSEGKEQWGFDLNVAPGLANRTGAPDKAEGLQGGLVRGRAYLNDGLVVVDDAKFALAGGTIALKGEIDTTKSPGSHVEGTFSGMPAPRLAALWPPGMAAGGRDWFTTNVRAGQVRSGSISYLSGRHLEPGMRGPSNRSTRFVVTMQADDVVFDPVPGMPPLSAPRVLARFEDDGLEVTLPDGAMDMGGGDVVTLKAGQFLGSDLLGNGASGEVDFKFSSSAGAVGKLLQTGPFAKSVDGSVIPENISGKMAGDVKIGFPLDADLKAEDVGFEVKARLKEGVIPDVLDGSEIKGASLDFHATPQAFNAKGEVLIKGVLAKLNWQRIVGAEAAKQPPLRLTARLDASDRKQLGIDLGELVVGDVPIEMTVSGLGDETPQVHVRSDLTSAELALGMIGWKKPAGREAFLEFDVVDGGAAGARTLSNFQVSGSDIAIAGSVNLDSKGRATRFDFPRFSLNLVSRLSANGARGKDGNWALKLNGTTYDGRSFFRSLFSVGEGRGAQDAGSSDGDGLDVEVIIDNVLGFEDVSLRKLSVALSSRGGKLSRLKGQGILDGGRPMAFELRRQAVGGQSKRILLVDAGDGGQAFKLVGFYPNMVGGRMRLEVDLDGRGAAEKIGTLWVDQFKILGDPVVSEVVGISDESVPAIARRRVTRQEFDFDRLRAPFSVGHGQIVLQDASIHGALLGATLRGKADFEKRAVDLGGTYVLLQGLNNVFGQIPIVGELLSGPRKEGIFGTNFAIRGSMDKPQVFVHPLSAIAPGIFREIFQMAPDGQSVLPRSGADSGGFSGAQSRSSSSPPSVGTSGGPGRTIEGWSSQTKRR